MVWVRDNSTFLIGVAGHRVLMEIDKLSPGIDVALRRVERAFARKTMTVISSLAEGADRLVARCALQRANARLVVPLPLPQSEYAKDFESEGSKREFLDLLARAEQVSELPTQPSRGDAYRAAGLYVLGRCDVLIAVWDGNPSQGSSGTAEIVAEARHRKLPIAWIHAGNRKPGTMEATSLGAEQGLVTFENFPVD